MDPSASLKASELKLSSMPPPMVVAALVTMMLDATESETLRMSAVEYLVEAASDSVCITLIRDALLAKSAKLLAFADAFASRTLLLICSVWTRDDMAAAAGPLVSAGLCHLLRHPDEAHADAAWRILLARCANNATWGLCDWDSVPTSFIFSSTFRIIARIGTRFSTQRVPSFLEDALAFCCSEHINSTSACNHTIDLMSDDANFDGVLCLLNRGSRAMLQFLVIWKDYGIGLPERQWQLVPTLVAIIRRSPERRHLALELANHLANDDPKWCSMFGDAGGIVAILSAKRIPNLSEFYNIVMYNDDNLRRLACTDRIDELVQHFLKRETDAEYAIQAVHRMLSASSDAVHNAVHSRVARLVASAHENFMELCAIANEYEETKGIVDFVDTAAGLDDYVRSHVMPTLVDTFICPITHCVMWEPVQASDNQTYEHSAILTWLESSKQSPITRQPLEDHLVSVWSLRRAIRGLREQAWRRLAAAPSTTSCRTLALTTNPCRTLAGHEGTELPKAPLLSNPFKRIMDALGLPTTGTVSKRLRS